MKITAGGNAIAAAQLASVTAVEKFEVVGTTANADITLNNNNAADEATLTIDASSLTTGTAIVDAALEADGKVVIIGGGAADTISGSISDHGDNITGGAGADTVIYATTRLTAIDTVAGGDGDDILRFGDNTTIVDAAFTNVTSVKTITAAADDQLTSVTIGTEAAEAGIDTVIFTDTAKTDSLVVEAGFTNNLSVTLDTDAAEDNSIVATNFTKVLTVNALDSDIDTRVTTITGGTGSDILKITAGGNAIAAAQLASVTAVDKFEIVGTTANANITLNNANATYTHEALFETLTIDGSSLTTGVLTLDASAEVDGKVVITGGGGDDVITADASVNVGSNISAGLGADTIHISADGVLTNIDTIAGGGGEDIMSFSANSTITDAHFANVSSIESLTGNTNIEFTSLTLGSNAQTTNVSTVTFAGDAASSLTVANGFTNTLTVNATAAVVSDNIDASASAAAIQVTSAAANIGAGDTIKGGTGTSDKLTITADDGTSTTTLMTGVENITVAYAANKDVSITMGANDTQIATGKTLTVDAALMTEGDEILTFTGNAAETDGFLNITGSAGADVITDAGAADTISGGDGADTITAAAGADSIVGGVGADSITGGAGADTLTGSAGADIFVYTAVSESNSTATDTITDFVSGADKLNVTLDYSGLGAGSHATVNATVVAAAAGVTAVQASLSAERGQFIHDTTNNKLYVNVNDDNLITTLDYQIATTTAAADGDINFTISGGAGNDTITSGAGADTISGGAGSDSITGGTGSDDFNNTGIAGGAVAADTITDFNVAQTDQLGAWDLSDFVTAGTTLTDLNTATSDVEATDAVQVFSNAGADGFDLDAAGANDNLLQLTGGFANVAAVQTSVRTFLAGSTTAADEGFLISWDDGTTNSYLGLVTYGAIDADGAAIADATVQTLGTISGIAAAESILEANFNNFVA